MGALLREKIKGVRWGQIMRQDRFVFFTEWVFLSVLLFILSFCFGANTKAYASESWICSVLCYTDVHTAPLS